MGPCLSLSLSIRIYTLEEIFIFLTSGDQYLDKTQSKSVIQFLHLCMDDQTSLHMVATLEEPWP